MTVATENPQYPQQRLEGLSFAFLRFLAFQESVACVIYAERMDFMKYLILKYLFTKHMGKSRGEFRKLMIFIPCRSLRDLLKEYSF